MEEELINRIKSLGSQIRQLKHDFGRYTHARVMETLVEELIDKIEELVALKTKEPKK